MNITEILQEKVSALAAQPGSKQDTAKKIDDFVKTLEEAIGALSKKEKMILFPKEAVLAGAPDFTLAIKHSLASKSRDNM